MAHIQKHLKELSNYFKVPLNKIEINDEKLPTINVNNKPVIGYLNIIFHLISKSELNGLDLLENAQIRQWLEYALVFVIQCDGNQQINQLLKELNGVLSTKTYLIGHRLTVADVVLYYSILNIMLNLTILDKEKYLHVSRWFDNLQQDSKLRQNHKLIDFNTNYLVNVAPARH